MSQLSAVCVLKKSAEYDFDYVEKLRDGVMKFLPGVPFSCLVSSEWPGWWCKMEMFNPSVTGDILYFDLDTIITGDLSDIASVNCLTMLSDFYHPQRLASGMMFLPEKDRGPIWDEWIADPEDIMSRYRGWGDGGFLNDLVPMAARWQDLLPGQVVSYKAHVRQSRRESESGNGTVPKGARVVCFHGQPRPRQLNWTI